MTYLTVLIFIIIIGLLAIIFIPSVEDASGDAQIGLTILTIVCLIVISVFDICMWISDVFLGNWEMGLFLAPLALLALDKLITKR
jgi:hypothetical protein